MTTSEIVEVQQRHDLTRAKMASIWAKIQVLENYVSRRDLTALHTNLKVLWAKMDNEMIECRKRNRATFNYQEAEDRLNATLKIMEREVFWQQLH